MTDVVWPVGMDRDLATRPLVFNPKGLLVAILHDEEAASGREPPSWKLGSVARTCASTTARRSSRTTRSTLRRAQKPMGRWGTHQRSGDNRSLLWNDSRGRGAARVHVPEKRDASRAMRYLIDHQVLYSRYFGSDEEIDIHARDA